jgi:hypothetical protein
MLIWELCAFLRNTSSSEGTYESWGPNQDLSWALRFPPQHFQLRRYVWELGAESRLIMGYALSPSTLPAQKVRMRVGGRIKTYHELCTSLLNFSSSEGTYESWGPNQDLPWAMRFPPQHFQLRRYVWELGAESRLIMVRTGMLIWELCTFLRNTSSSEGTYESWGPNQDLSWAMRFPPQYFQLRRYAWELGAESRLTMGYALPPSTLPAQKVCMRVGGRIKTYHGQDWYADLGAMHFPPQHFQLRR